MEGEDKEEGKREAEESEERIEEKSEEVLEDRTNKMIGFFKKSNLWVIGILILALILGIYIRSLPMQDHGGNPGLWDITTNTWTLGPDLDPWLFLRYAKTIVEEGSLPDVDTMRNVPVGFNTATETRLLPYMIAGTYWISSLFYNNANIEFAGAVFPVIMFAFTILAFFLFTREIFNREDKESKTKANIIALISTFFMIVIPAFLSRTVAGIPEKESAGFFFMFLTFFLFLKSWKSKNLKKAMIFGLLAGISTTCMGLIWGGVSYVYVTIAIASLLALILNKVHKKEFIVYSLWIVSSFILINLFSNRSTLKGMITSLDSGLAFSVFFIFLVHFILWNTKLKKAEIWEKIKIPKNIISLIIAIILGIILVLFFLGPSFMIEKLKALNQMFFKPVTGRWNITVAENRQPFFTEWAGSFGPFIKKIPVLFWLFFIGSVVLFKKMLDKIKKKDSWVLTGLYVLFFFGLVFSRYSSSSLFNGENFISKVFYYGSALLMIGSFIYYYIKYHKEKNKGFEKINYEFLLLFSLFALCLFTARSAVRLIMVLATIAPIFVGYLIISLSYRFKNTKDETIKIILGIIVILVLVLGVFVFWNFYKGVRGQAYGFVPSYYNQQWQKAMLWVRENTAEDAVFAHWWDYGYWLQSIGNRATVTDGGNAMVFWNYLSGRLVLTGDNQKDALDFLYSHNSTYLLIDSTDIGKYTAFSSIGSDENYDRYSWIPSMISDERQIQETRNSTIRVYQGGSMIDEDIVYEQGGKEIFLPAQNAAVIGVILEISQKGESLSFNKQPEGIFYYQGQQIRIPLRYIYVNGQFVDFKTGLEGCVYIIERVDQANQGVSVDEMGALMYLSPRIMRGLLGQIYLLDDPFNNFPNFELAHSEPNLIIESLNSQGMNLNEFVFYQGIQGPIKIWEIQYTGEEEFKQEYIESDYSKYIDWKL